MKKIKLGFLSSLLSISLLTGCSFNKGNRVDYAFIKGDDYLGHVVIDNVVYTYNKDNTATILCSKKSSIKKINFKASIEVNNITYPVVDINDNAFKNCSSLEQVTLPHSILKIGNNAFYNCVNLKSFIFNEGLTSIGNSAFEKCKSLDAINFPSSLSNIGYYAFASCSNLKAFEVSNENKTFSSLDGILYQNNSLKLYPSGKDIKELTLDDFVTSIEDCAFSFANNIEKIELNSVTKIGKYAFYNCENLSKIDFGQELESIDDGAFSNCKVLHYVNFPSKTTTIGNYAFYGCEELYTAYFSKSVSEVKSYAFVECPSLILIGENGISTNKWDSTYRGDRPVYWGASFLNVTIIDDIVYKLEQKGATVLGRSNAIEDVIIPNTVTHLGETYNVVAIAQSAFEKDKHVKHVKIGDNVASINNYAFYENTVLETLEIENAPARLEKDSFNKCNSLKKIILGENIEAISSEAFREIPNACFNAYDNAYYLGNADNPYRYLIRALSKNISSCRIHNQTYLISDAAFRYCLNIKTLTLPLNIQSIGNYALYNCPKLKALKYKGNKEEFKAIQKGSNWKYSELESVECSDGELLLI